MPTVLKSISCACAVLLILLGCCANVHAEKPVILKMEAYAGAPFGVAKVSFRLGQSGKLIQNTGAVRITERDNRIFYPAFSDGLLTALFDRPAVGGIQSVWFLFRGDEPLNVVIENDEATSFQVELSRRRPALGRILYQAWWRRFNIQNQNRIKDGDYPPLVETYLNSMLQKRLDLPQPATQRIMASSTDELQETLGLLFDAESIRAETIRQMMLQSPEMDQASIAIPAPTEWLSGADRLPDRPVPVEPIVRYVPEECFYLRFGSWDNQLWLKRLMEEYQGDLSRMISLRGHVGGDSTKMMDQLALESSQIDDLFGGNLILDVAAIGTDLYVEDGPANAILMLAKNKSLEGNIRSKRKKFARDRAEEGVTLVDLEIGGHPVTFLSSPDNRFRSYYAVKDLCHITSSSRYIIERFIESADGNGSLADSVEFQQARQVMPLDRNDTVFVYLSRRFFENLLSPQYQIELARRNRSLANIQLLQLAQWSASNEGYADDDIDQMIAHGFLPENFNLLPDGSSTHWVQDQWHDTLRGRRGYFKPIADMEVELITPTESRWLEERLAYYRNELKEVDPILLAFQRYELNKEVERVVFDGRIAPFGQEKYGWVGRVLGPPLEHEVDMGPEALMSLQGSISGSMLTRSTDPHQIFGSVQGDIPPKTDLQPASFLELMNLLKSTPGYIGAWPTAGYLDLLPALGAEPDAEGYTYSRILGVWRLQQEQFALISFDRMRLESARQEVNLVPAERPAQIRLRVGDLSSSNLRDWANILYFDRSWQTSVANVRLLNMMIQQFNLPPETVKAQAEQLLGVQLVCPLEGEYELCLTEGSRNVWQSSQWPSFDEPRMPEDYVAPPMEWFRGFSMDVYQRETQFVVHGSIDIARDPSSMGSGAGKLLGNLPSIDLFKGFSKVEEVEAVESDDNELQAPRNDKTPQDDKR